MHVQAFKTPLITAQDDLYQAIARAIPTIPERSVLVVASKIVATTEGRFVPKHSNNKEEKFALVRKEAELYTDHTESKYDIMLTVKMNSVWVNAGIDESNADGQYLLWPEDPQNSVNQIWQFLRSHYGLKEVGVTMSDSRSFPLNWGVVGHAIVHCGFKALKSYIGKPDLFGRLLQMEQVNMMQGITSAAVLEMGEGDESTPLGLVSDIKDIEFCDHEPTAQELADLKIELKDDVYAPMLEKVDWKKGDGGK